jgi:hypothetical protein
MEMVDVIMNLTGSTDNDFTMASEVLEEIGFVVGQKIMERCVFLLRQYEQTSWFRCKSSTSN